MKAAGSFPVSEPSPFFRGLWRWVLAVLFSFGAWQIYVLAPLPGLIGVGLAPFVNMYLFFRGLGFMQRGILHWRTVRTARRLQLEPGWGASSGGYLLVDDKKGLWVGNGRAGRLSELGSLCCRVEERAFLLELRKDEDSAPLVSVGVEDEAELELVCARLAESARGHGAAPRVKYKKTA